MKQIERISIVMLIGIALAVYWFVHTDIKDVALLDVMKRHALQLQVFVDQQYGVSLCAYLALFICATMLFLPCTILLTILGGFLFGGLPGAFYASIGATLGGGLIFLIVRYLLADWVQKKIGQRFARFDAVLQKNDARYLLMLQISPVTPTFVINLCMGLTNISLWTYAWATFLGTLPGSFIYACAGEQLQSIRSVEQIMPPVLFALLLTVSLIGLVPIVCRRLFSKRER